MKVLDIFIEENINIAKDIYLLSFKNKYITDNYKPGNFINIKIQDNSIYPLLRRPFSIAFIQNDMVYIGYQVIGVGTELLAKKKNGDILNVIGPLGNNFEIPQNIKSVSLIGGGMGIWPLYGLAKQLSQNKVTFDVYLGFRNKEKSFFIDKFKNVANNIYITSDDGSIGFKGNIIELFTSNKKNYEIIYSCGPKVMLRALKDLNLNNQIYVSLEEKMACGIGACLGCSIKGENDNIFHVCSDGPVFNIMEVNLDESKC